MSQDDTTRKKTFLSALPFCGASLQYTHVVQLVLEMCEWAMLYVLILFMLDLQNKVCLHKGYFWGNKDIAIDTKLTAEITLSIHIGCVLFVAIFNHYNIRIRNSFMLDFKRKQWRISLAVSSLIVMFLIKTNLVDAICIQTLYVSHIVVLIPLRITEYFSKPEELNE